MLRADISKRLVIDESLKLFPAVIGDGLRPGLVDQNGQPILQRTASKGGHIPHTAKIGRSG